MRIVISNTSNEPIYSQIVNQLKSQIIKGDLSEGEILPSIRALARDLQISVITTKRAYEELEKAGFVETVPGKGSYVAAQNLEFMREKKLRLVEDKLSVIVDESKLMGFTYDDINAILKILFEEG